MRYTVDTWTSGTAAASSSAVNAPSLAPDGVDHGRPGAPDAVARRPAAGPRSRPARRAGRGGPDGPSSRRRPYAAAARSRPPTASGRRAGRPGRRPPGRGRRGCRGRRRARSCPMPTSTSVPTIERTIWWQNAVARISKRRWCRVVELGPAGRQHPPRPATPRPPRRRAGARSAAAAERGEVVLADQRVAGRPHRPQGQRLGHEPGPPGEQRVRRRRVPDVVAVVPPRRREAGVEVVVGPRRVAHGDGRRAQLVEPAGEVVEVGRRRAGRRTRPGPRRGRRRRSARRRSARPAAARPWRRPRRGRPSRCARPGWRRTRGTPPRRRRRSSRRTRHRRQSSAG